VVVGALFVLTWDSFKVSSLRRRDKCTGVKLPRVLGDLLPRCRVPAPAICGRGQEDVSLWLLPPAFSQLGATTGKSSYGSMLRRGIRLRVRVKHLMPGNRVGRATINPPLKGVAVFTSMRHAG